MVIYKALSNEVDWVWTVAASCTGNNSSLLAGEELQIVAMATLRSNNANALLRNILGATPRAFSTRRSLQSSLPVSIDTPAEKLPSQPDYTLPADKATS